MRRVTFSLSDIFLSEAPAIISSAQVQLQALQNSFTQQALNGSNLLSMSAASLAFRLVRIGLSSLNPFLTSALALGGEVAVYRGVNQIFSAHQEQGSNLKNFLRDYIHFACLRGFGFLTPSQSLWGQGIQTAGMVATESLLTHLQFLPKQNLGLAERFVQAFSMNLAVATGSSLSSIFFGAVCHRLERSFENLSLLSSHKNQRILPEYLPRLSSQRRERDRPLEVDRESSHAKQKIGDVDLETSELFRAFSLDARDRLWLRSQDKGALQRNLINHLSSSDPRLIEYLGHFFRQADLNHVNGKDQKLRLLYLLFQPGGSLVLEAQLAYQVLNRLGVYHLPRELGLCYNEGLLKKEQRRLVLGGDESVASAVAEDVMETHIHPHQNNLSHVFPSMQDLRTLWLHRGRTEFEGREKVQWVFHAKGASCFVREGKEIDIYWALRGVETRSRIRDAIKLNETLYAPLPVAIRFHRVDWEEMELHLGDTSHWLARQSGR